jgi:acetate kinase
LLILNAGSSSLKFALFAPPLGDAGPRLMLRGQIAGIGVAPSFAATDRDSIPLPAARVDGAVRNHTDALALLFAWLAQNGHGSDFSAARTLPHRPGSHHR